MTTAPTGKSAHQRGLELASQGRHEEALARLHEHLLEHPADGEALNDAGALLHALGRFEEAARNFQRASEILGPAAVQTLVNLAESCLAANQPGRVADLLDDLARAGVLNADFANRTAMKLMEQGRNGPALAVLARSLSLSPRQKDIPEIHAQLRGSRPRIALLSERSALENFDDIRRLVDSQFQARGVHCGPDQDAQRISGAIDWCDIAWLDGCPALLGALTSGEKRRRTVCRLSLREAMDPLLDQVQWEKVDALVIQGGKALRETLLRSAPGSLRARRIVELPPAVDVAGIPDRSRPRGKTLAWVMGREGQGSPALLLQCLHALRTRDGEYRLHVAGVFRDGDLSWRYMRHMARRMSLDGAIVFDGWQEDLPRWLQDKDFLVSTGVLDAWRGDILQAMAAGVKPVVHAFPGSEEFLPSECLFDTVEEFARLVCEGPYTPDAYREHVRRRFSLRDQLRTIEGLLEELENEITEPPKVACERVNH